MLQMCQEGLYYTQGRQWSWTQNTELMVYLRVRGFYFIPDLPNLMHVTQEMELLTGELKSTFYKNLENSLVDN